MSARLDDPLVALERPDPAELERQAGLLKAWSWLLAPRSFGLERVPRQGPLLFVGNHTLMGVFDGPIMFLELYRQTGIYPRALGDHLHFKIPLWRDQLRKAGVVDGTRDNCARLFAAGESVLVYPGGGREVAKRRGEAYRLIWKRRMGFARMAIRFGVPIVPFAAVGAEEAWDIVYDADDLMQTPLGWLVRRLGLRDEVLIPMVRGLGNTPLPRPERLYFWFGAPIPTAHVQGQEDDDEVAFAVREQVRAAVEGGIAELHAVRDDDPERALMPRVLGQLRRALGAEPAA